MSIHVGPLPTPETLRRYDDLVPGYAKKLAGLHLRQVRRELDEEAAEGDHRRQAERDEQRLFAEFVAGLRRATWYGQTLGGALATATLALCAYMAWLGHATQAAAVAVSVPAALVAAFVYARSGATPSAPASKSGPP